MNKLTLEESVNACEKIEHWDNKSIGGQYSVFHGYIGELSNLKVFVGMNEDDMSKRQEYQLIVSYENKTLAYFMEKHGWITYDLTNELEEEEHRIIVFKFFPWRTQQSTPIRDIYEKIKERVDNQDLILAEHARKQIME